MNDESPNGQGISEHVHQAPSAPGWKLLLQAAITAVSNSATLDDMELLTANLIARKDEHIPEANRMEVFTAVAAAACSFDEIDWYKEFSEFLYCQLGKEGLTNLLDGSGYRFCDCGKGSLGYHVSKANLNERQFFEYIRRNLFGSIGIMIMTPGGKD